MTAVSASTCLPLGAEAARQYGARAGPGNSPGHRSATRDVRAVAGGYFEAMGIRLLRGRRIDRGDIERSEPVVVVNEAFAERFFPNQDPIGERVASNRPPRPGEGRILTWLTIVGVVSNTPTRTLATPIRWPQVYMPMSIAGGPEFPISRWLDPTSR